MTRYEYKRQVFIEQPNLHGTPQGTEQRLNVLGAEGWELVAVWPDGTAIIGILKRPLQDNR